MIRRPARFKNLRSRRYSGCILGHAINFHYPISEQTPVVARTIPRVGRHGAVV